MNKDGITINVNSSKALNSVVGHEITHVLEGTDLYESLKSAVETYAKTKGEYDSRLEQLTKLYQGKDGYTDGNVQTKLEREMVADLVGDYLFTDKAFVESLSRENRNVFQKIFDQIKHLCKLATAGSEEARQLENVKKIFQDVYREASENGVKNPTAEGGVMYSLMAFEKDGRRFVEIDQDQDRFDGHSADEYPSIAKDIIKEKFENRVIGIDNKMFVNGAGRSEFAYPSKPITDADIYEAKMRAAAELDNLLDAGTNFRNEADGKDGHVHPDAIGGFDYFDTLFKIGERYFEGRINIKNIKRGKLFTDVTQIKDVTQAIMSSYGKNPKSQFLRTSSMNSIRNPERNVNTTNSRSMQKKTDAGKAGKVGWDGRVAVTEATGPNITIDGVTYRLLGLDENGSKVYQDVEVLKEQAAKEKAAENQDKATQTENGQESVENSENRDILTLSTRYLNKNDPLYEYTKKITPLDGFEDVVTHGDPISLVFKDADGKESNVSAEEFVQILKDDPNYKGGNIRLVACQVAADGGAIPKYIAKELGVTVIAPTESVNVDWDGNMFLANNEKSIKLGLQTGEWLVFEPGKEAISYDLYWRIQ